MYILRLDLPWSASSCVYWRRLTRTHRQTLWCAQEEAERQRSMEAAAAEVHAILQGARPPRGSGPTYRTPGALATAAHARPPDMPPGGPAGAAGAACAAD